MTASADHPPEVPTSVAYAENHSRPVQSGNANQTTAPVLSWDVQALFWMSFNAPAGPPERRRSAVAHLRRKITSIETDSAAFEINGAQRIIHRRPSPANFVLPWRRRAP